MGSGGRATERSKYSKSEVVKRAPSSKPPFTHGDIKRVIPPHCFERSLIRSSSYLFFDLFLSSLFYYIAAVYIPASRSLYRMWHGPFIGSSKAASRWVCGSLATRAATKLSATTHG
ncbi:hypothetical protein OSB04_020726 [Centaurea solstitialis]|uniref:Fatty acid desaturase N-terminal domain-containing protein n=1 Tax=Centaurea solstitialis TaxID=347529 RepID=A0AA38TCF3_9ASTR|nr:hypothetical protein OSB04_020726 [Centaurea solstitialis]